LIKKLKNSAKKGYFGDKRRKISEKRSDGRIDKLKGKRILGKRKKGKPVFWTFEKINQIKNKFLLKKKFRKKIFNLKKFFF